MKSYEDDEFNTQKKIHNKNKRKEKQRKQKKREEVYVVMTQTNESIRNSVL